MEKGMIERAGPKRETGRIARGERGLRRCLLASTFATGVLLAFAAQAQTAAGIPSTPPADARAATAERVVPFNISAQDLDTALTRLADEGGIHLLFTSRDVAGLRSPGLSGRYTVSQALTRLLSGSGMTWHVTEPGTVTLEKAPAGTWTDGAMALPPVQVEARQPAGDAQSPYRPGVGYVATRSVAGTKTDTPQIETPQAITTITKDQIRDQGAQTVGAAIRYTPGVIAEEYGGTDLRLDRYMLRGFSDTMPYLDGLATTGRYTLLSNDVEPYGLERIEVLHGPSSVMYGQNAPGGILDLTSKRPTDTPLHEVQLQTGSYGRIQGAFDLSGPVNDDGTLLYRLTGVARDTGTQVDHVDDQHYYIAPALTWRPDPDTSLTLLSHFQRQQDGMLSQQFPALGTLYTSPFGKIPTNLFIGEQNFNKWNRTEWGVGYAFEHRFDDTWTVRQNFRYTQADVDIAYIGGSGLEDGTAILDRYALGAKAWVANLALDTWMQAKFGTGPVSHTVIFGVDYAHSSDRWTEQDDTAAPLNLLDPVYGGAIDLPAADFATVDRLSQAGLYAQDQIRWKRWALTAGIRHDWADTTVQDMIANTSTPQHDQATTGRVGLVYLFDNGFAPYASYSTSFQPTVGTTFDGTPYKPTTGTQYEVGVKYQPNGFNSFVTLSAYNLTQQNMLTTDPDHPLFDTQTGEVRIRGVELSGTADLGGGLKLVGAYTYMDPTITANTDGSVGNQPKDIPNNMASLWADETIQSGPLSGLGVGGGVRYIGSRYGDDANTLKLPGVTLFDAAVHYDFKSFRVAVNATNLFDKTYVGTCDSATACYYGLRRNVLATLSYHW